LADVKTKSQPTHELFPVILVIHFRFSKLLPETEPDILLIHHFPGKLQARVQEGFTPPRKFLAGVQEGFTPARKFHAGVQEGFTPARKFHAGVQEGFAPPRKFQAGVKASLRSA